MASQQQPVESGGHGDKKSPANELSPQSKRQEPNMLVLAGVGLEFGVVMVAMALGGWWLDEKLGTKPWLLLSGVFVGFIGGLANLWRLGKRYF